MHTRKCYWQWSLFEQVTCFNCFLDRQIRSIFGFAIVMLICVDVKYCAQMNSFFWFRLILVGWDLLNRVFELLLVNFWRNEVWNFLYIFWHIGFWDIELFLTVFYVDHFLAVVQFIFCNWREWSFDLCVD